MLQDLVIGIDAGTTGCKTVVWDSRGKKVAEGRGGIPMLRPRLEWHEQRGEDWQAALVDSLRIALKTVQPSRLAGLCICPQRETFIPVDENGRPLRNAILWMDNRAREWLPDLEKAFGSEAFQTLTGKPLSGNLTLLKLRWLREQERDTFHRTAMFLDTAAFLNRFLTGQGATGWGIADPTGLFDMVKKTWAEKVLAYLQILPEQLPAALPGGAYLGALTLAAAQETGLPEGLPVFAGLGDGQAGGLALNILQPGECYLSLGTSVVSGTYSAQYLTSRHFRTMFAGSPTGFSLETVILGGTYTVDWFIESLGKGYSLPELEEGAEDILAGSAGLILVPYWNSALNPYWDSNARGITLGWTGDHGPFHFYRAILEGIAYELRLHFEGVETALGDAIERLVVMGGGSNSELWCQIIADVSGKTLHRSDVVDGCALGAGMIAAYGAGWYATIQEAAKAMAGECRQLFHPNPDLTRRYTQIYEQVYQKIFPAIQSLVRRLSELTRE